MYSLFSKCSIIVLDNKLLQYCNRYGYANKAIAQYQKMSILPPQKGLEFPGGWGLGGSLRPKKLKKCIKFIWNFQRGGESWKKTLLWGRYMYGYFLKLHNLLFQLQWSSCIARLVSFMSGSSFYYLLLTIGPLMFISKSHGYDKLTE